jgi:hypothetical protein
MVRLSGHSRKECTGPLSIEMAARIKTEVRGARPFDSVSVMTLPWRHQYLGD